MINSDGVLVIVKDYERDKMYRLTRRYKALINLLDITVIKDKSNSAFIQKIKNNIESCKDRQNNWWNKIYKRYNLEEYRNQKLKFSIYTGEIKLD